MKNNDVIEPFENSLFILFGTTGERKQLTTLRVDQGVTFFCAENAIKARVHGNPMDLVLVEEFSSSSLASSALQGLYAAMRKHARRRRFASGWKAAIKWVFAPFVGVVLALAVNMAATRALTSSSVAGAAAAPMVPIPQSALRPPAAAAPRAPVATSAQLARAMADGAKSEKYAVKLSGGSKGTLYVFSDPSCPHCQELEPELDKLAKDYTVYVFPVSVIGGEGSSHRAAKLLCDKPSDRAPLWKKIVGGADLPNKECAEGVDAIARNDEMFRVMRFVGTPTIINGAGEQTPDTIPNTADAINQWMATSTTASK